MAEKPDKGKTPYPDKEFMPVRGKRLRYANEPPPPKEPKTPKKD